MNVTAPFSDVIDSIEVLRAHYRNPGQGAIAKVTHAIDEGCRDFIALSTLVLIGTADSDGRHDVSPRGGPAGFVRVLDENRLAIPDLNGNNRLDTLGNLIERPGIGLLFLLPGLDETLRINGTAWVTTDDTVLDLFTDQVKRPTTAIGVQVEHAYLHCAKALRRGGLWDPTTWPDATTRPSVGRIFMGHVGTGATTTPEEVEARLEDSYVEDLAADSPDP